LLFIAVGIAIERARTRDVYRMRGAAGGAPLLRIGVIVGALAISGVPPLNGFVGKELIGDVLYGSPAYTLLLITSVGTTASFVKLSRIAWPGSDRASAAAAAAAPMGHAGERIGRAGSAIRAPAEAEPSPPMRPMRLSPLDGTAVATLIGLVCATGIAGGPAVRTLHRITAPNVAPPSTDFFSLSSVAEAMVPVAFGVAVAFVVMSPRGRAAAHRLQRVSPQLRTVLVFFVLGLMLFALAPLLVFGT
jgi:hydrogenase-4 component B